MTPRRIRFKQAQEAKKVAQVQAQAKQVQLSVWEQAKAKAIADRQKRK